MCVSVVGVFFFTVQANKAFAAESILDTQAEENKLVSILFFTHIITLFGEDKRLKSN